MLLIHNADLYTMHPAMPRAEAAIVEGDRIAFVGTLPAARLFLAGRPHDALDADGATVIPGFHDSHMHLLHTALRARRVQMAGARSIADAQRLLRDGLARAADGWLASEGWNQERFAERRLLTRADLDAVSADVPILATRACGHIAAANGAALARAGLSEDTRFADGILREDEIGLVSRHIPGLGLPAMLDALREVQHGLLAKGITSVQSDDLGGLPIEGRGAFVRGVRDLCASGGLRLRYAMQAGLGTLEEMRAFFADGLHRVGGPGFRVAHAKLLADGSLGARTAWLRADYADAPGQRGIALYDDVTLAALVREAAAHGLPCAIHAIGDAAMAQVLDAFAAAPGPRHAVVHAQLTDAAQVARCGRMGLTILAQPVFLDADAPIVRRRAGDALAGTSYRWRAMQGSGAHVAFGTDCPVEPYDPMPGLYCAATRRPLSGDTAYLPEEAFTLADALYAYTAAGAYASGEEADKGRLWPGMLADIAVLDRWLDPGAPEEWLGVAARATFVGGACVYGN